MAQKAIVYVGFPGGTASFVDIIGTPNAPGLPRLTPATFELDPPIPGVIEQNPPDPVTHKSGNLRVLAKVTIEFQLATGYGFSPAGIAFKQTKAPAGSSDSNGRDNLPKTKIVITDDPRKLPSIEVYNDFKAVGAAWNVLLVIQNAQGQLGVLDPEIENSDLTVAPQPSRRRAKA